MPLEKIRVNKPLFWQKMDNLSPRFDHGGMKKAAAKRPPKQYAPVYLNEWLTALGVKPTELAEAGLISASYVSNLKKGRKLNPSPGKLMQIGAFLKIQWTDLYRPPPSEKAIEELDTFAATTLNRIRSRGR